MLVNSFDTKFGKTAEKYENLDNHFVTLLKKKKLYKRIFTSVVIDKKITHNITLRADITGQILNSIISQYSDFKHNLYYMGDVFKSDILSSDFKQFREHGLEIINQDKLSSFNEATSILIQYLNAIIKNEFCFIFTDPKLKKNEFIFNKKKIASTSINPFIKSFSSKHSKIKTKLNLETNFFSKEYHEDIFFYVYSTKSKKILSQGGGYKYKKNNKILNGFGFSCNVDNLVEVI